MASSIRAQALFLLLGAAAGFALGLFYDLLRPLRRRSADAFWDLLFCAGAAGLCFCLAMRAENGRLGSGQLMAALGSLGLYEQLVSPILSPIFEKSAALVGKVWKSTEKSTKNFYFLAKKLFQKTNK